MNVSVMAVTSAMGPFSQSAVSMAVRQQIAGDAAAGNGSIQPPQSFAALREILRDGPILEELRAVVEDAAEAAFVDQMLEQHHGRHAAVVVPDHVSDLRGLHGMRPSLSASAALRPSGFSHSTILPACAAAMAISACVSLGLAISIRSMSLRSTSLRQSVSTDSIAPVFREGFGAFRVARADGFEHGPVRQIEETAGLEESVGMGAAHEAVAD